MRSASRARCSEDWIDPAFRSSIERKRTTLSSSNSS
jgi:hypothetical protein